VRAVAVVATDSLLCPYATEAWNKKDPLFLAKSMDCSFRKCER